MVDNEEVSEISYVLHRFSGKYSDSNLFETKQEAVEFRKKLKKCK